ncbi:Oar protein [Acidisarcina polymorpha]|uniref:Oar protein n=1 Tax=Acidisarcina polymorpha TaxID=2211140 RepID=A0A2Z5FXT8_9BACT|nr:Oar protein [Acidisarcina polymorpha]
MAQGQRVFGQVDEGSIAGTVTDPTGAVVPSAKVTLLNIDQGLTLEASTNSSGEYSFSPVRIGNYSVSVTAPGFSTTTQQHLSVSVSQHLQVDVQLKTGAATETVEVTTAPPQLQADDASVGQVIGERSVNSLPLNGRNFTFLAQLGAGVNTPQADTRGNSASGAFSANGLRPAQNNYLLDGIDNNSNAVDFLNGTNFVILPPVDAIQEFKVQTADFSAEFGRSAGAVLNATIKSGTNSIHGAVWEFFRNDKLDAADWFEDNQGIPKGELRQNQFGASIGGPILKNKIFFFGDYEGLRRVQGNTQSGVTVPTVAERSSNYTNLADIITGAPRADALGRQIPGGVILDPATTRAVTKGVVDPVSGIVAPTTGYVRDPFSAACGPGTASYSLAACPDLNQLPGGRLDPNAIKLLNLFPNPTSAGVSSNFGSSPNLYEHRNQFDVRGDYDPSAKDQVFVRFSYEDDPNLIPGPFGGIADGGGFQEGNQSAKSDQAVAGYTHVFTPSTINVIHGGFNHLHTTRYGPVGSTLGIPAQFGIQGIPQVSENGGLPAISISGLSTLGSNSYLPSDEVSQTLQITDDFTKIYGSHSFKTGIEYQHVKFSTLQPAYSRGTFSYNSNSSSVSFTDIPNVGGGATGKGQFLLVPELATVPNGVNYVGGSDQVQASNINKTYDVRNYFAAYFQDDWKVNQKLTLNLGLRWDYFGPIGEANGGQANFVQDGPPNGVPTYLIPATGKDDRSLSSTANNPALNGSGFLDLLAKDGIALEETDRYGKGLYQTQKTNFAPRLGFAYQATPRLVARGGFGFSYNAFENQGYGPNIGENYPFVFNFNYSQANLPGYVPSVTPISASTPWAGCGTAGPGGTATLSSGFSCIGFTPLAVDASGLGLQGLQFNYKTPRTLSSNFALQYAVTRTLSIQAAYVLTNGTNLQTGIGNNQVSQLLPANASTSNFVPFPDFGHGGSYQRTIGRSIYNGGLLTLEQQAVNGLSYLFTYTFSKTLSDAGDLLNGGNNGGYRAPYVPGAGIKYDWGPADFDIRNVFHASGGYELPFGKGKHFLGNANALTNSAVGGWSLNWIATLEGGQPVTFSCPSTSGAGTGCYDVLVPGQSAKLGLHTDSNGKLNWIGNPAAFQQPCLLGGTAGAPVPVVDSPSGCVPLNGLAALGGGLETLRAPGVTKFDLSAFKAFQVTERVSMQFRAEFFNILNHPNFNAPGFGGNGVVAITNSTNFTDSRFGEIGSTRDAPYDPRQIQFALKLYY